MKSQTGTVVYKVFLKDISWQKANKAKDPSTPHSSLAVLPAYV